MVNEFVETGTTTDAICRIKPCPFLIFSTVVPEREEALQVQIRTFALSDSPVDVVLVSTLDGGTLARRSNFRRLGYEAKHPLSGFAVKLKLDTPQTPRFLLSADGELLEVWLSTVETVGF
jgi:hypothetical protein